MSETTERTILKWVGSKARIMDQLSPHLPKTPRLVEPFAGSCAVMMNTDYERYLIADMNADLMTMYQQIASDNINTVLTTALNLFQLEAEFPDYYVERAFFNKSKHVLPPEFIAAYFIYLNRHCYNGLCRYNQSGRFNVPHGSYKSPYFPEGEIRAFAEKSKRAKLINADWQETLDNVVRGDGIYCDPPYLNTFSGYTSGGFDEQDHEQLAKSLHVLWSEWDVPCAVSNSADAKELYADMGFKVREIEAPRSVAASGNRKKAREIIAVLK